MRNLTGFSTDCRQPKHVSVILNVVKDLVQIGLRALVDPENRFFRRIRGRDTAKTLRQDDVHFCGQASSGHPELVERSNDSLTKACRDTVVALWPRPF